MYAVDRHDGDGLQSLAGAGALTSEVDVTSMDSITKLKETIGNEPVDLLLNIAGIAFAPDQDGLESTTLEAFEKIFAVNTYGPMFVTQSLLPNILASEGKKIGIITSRVGSVGDNSSGGMYAYRSSKAAANSIGKSMAMNLKEKGVTVMLLHPGFVATGILPLGRRNPETVEPEEAATKLWKNIVSQKTLEDTGKFWHREGFELPW